MPKGVEVEQVEGKYWLYRKRGPKGIEPVDVREILQWVLEQVAFAQFCALPDEEDSNSTLVFGRAAARAQSQAEAELISSCWNLATDFEHSIARAREGGTDRQGIEAIELFRDIAPDIADRGYRLAAASRVLDLLGRIERETEKLDLIDVGCKAPTSVRQYLAKATRCWLYLLPGACAALCRACVEEALKYRLKMESGDFMALITRGSCESVLDKALSDAAHTVRKTGNRMLHGGSISQRDAERSLERTRLLVKHLFAA